MTVTQARASSGSGAKGARGAKTSRRAPLLGALLLTLPLGLGATVSGEPAAAQDALPPQRKQHQKVSEILTETSNLIYPQNVKTGENRSLREVSPLHPPNQNDLRFLKIPCISENKSALSRRTYLKRRVAERGPGGARRGGCTRRGGAARGAD